MSDTIKLTQVVDTNGQGNNIELRVFGKAGAITEIHVDTVTFSNEGLSRVATAIQLLMADANTAGYVTVPES